MSEDTSSQGPNKLVMMTCSVFVVLLGLAAFFAVVMLTGSSESPSVSTNDITDNTTTVAPNDVNQADRNVVNLLNAENAGSARQPHIVFVLADDLGYSDVGYLNSRMKTPTINGLAENGVILSAHYTQPYCTPSRAALLTGKYPIHLGMQHNKVIALQPTGLPLDAVTLADALRERGYATHLVGKWDLGFFKEEYMPLNRGFDTFFGMLAALGDHFTHTLCSPGFGAGETRVIECGYDLRDGHEVSWNNTEYSTHLFTRKAVERIQEHGQNHENEPMFLYLSYQAPHGPLQVPESYLDEYPTIEDIRRKTFNAMVTCLDEGLRNVTRALVDAEMLSNTVFVFTSDNGGAPRDGGFNWPLRGAKATLWEGGIRTPTIVASPLIEKPKGERTGIMHISDWFPTFINLAGGDASSMNLDGVDQWPMISRGEPSGRQEILHNIDPLQDLVGETLHEDTFNNQQRAALRQANWKLITGDPSPGTWWALPDTDNNNTLSSDPRSKNLWLFHMEIDPFETTDISADHPDRVRQMLDILEQHEDTAVPPNYPPNDLNSAPSLNGGIWTSWMD